MRVRACARVCVYACVCVQAGHITDTPSLEPAGAPHSGPRCLPRAISSMNLCTPAPPRRASACPCGRRGTRRSGSVRARSRGRRWAWGAAGARPAPPRPAAAAGKPATAGAGVTGFHWALRAEAGIPWRRNACDGGAGLSRPRGEAGPDWDDISPSVSGAGLGGEGQGGWAGAGNRRNESDSGCLHVRCALYLLGPEPGAASVPNFQMRKLRPVGPHL